MVCSAYFSTGCSNARYGHSTWAWGLGTRAWPGAEVQSEDRHGGDAGCDDEHGGAEAVGGGDPQRLPGKAVRVTVGDEDKEGESDGGADRRARRGDARGDALLAVGDARPGGDEHRREDGAVADAERDQSRDQRGVGAVGGHGKAERQGADRAEGERSDQGGLETKTRDERAGEGRAGDHDGGWEQEPDAGFQGVVATHVLEVEREEVEHRSERRPE
jgi:hypothetical protein